MKLVIDFETRSPVDIKKHGAFVYAEHPDTEIMCLGITVDDGPARLWVPDKFFRRIERRRVRYQYIEIEEVFNLVRHADTIVAQNSMFEYLIWNVVGRRQRWPKLPLEKLHDMMAQLAYHALPLNLEQAGAALNLPIQKDRVGHTTMLRLCKPRKAKKSDYDDPDFALCVEQEDGSWYHPESESRFYLWHQGPDDLITLFNYCGRDVEAERLIYDTLPDLPPFERDVWLMDQRINLRGMPVDIESVKAIVDVVEKREGVLRERFKDITGGAVSGPRSYVALKDWVNEQAGNINVDSVNKNAAAELMAADDTPEHVKAALKVKAEIGKASVSKLTALLNRSNKDGRMRGAILYHGAATGRWSGRGFQPQNLPRDSYKPDDYEAVVSLFKSGDEDMISMLYDDPFYVASRCVRGSVQTTEDKEFVCSDFSSVESCGLAWLADDFVTMDAIRRGEDLYKKAIAAALLKDYSVITKDERQAGKPIELGNQYGGGIGAFETFSKTYGVDPAELVSVVLPTATEDELEGDYGAIALAKGYLKRNPETTLSLDAATTADVMKQRWRRNRRPVVQFWKDCGAAATMAVENPDNVYRVGKTRFCKRGDFLRIMLPSGRLLHYYKADIRPMKASWGETVPSITYMGMKVVDGKTTRQWVRLATWGSRIVENITQAHCRDLLAAAMLRLEKAGYPIVLHVHDECAAERDAGTSDLEEYNRIMSIVPEWSAGMPIAADGWIGRRYRKG